MGEKRNAYRFWWQNHKERDEHEDLDIVGRTIWILKKYEGG
jgi:hypothetical protein